MPPKRTSARTTSAKKSPAHKAARGYRGAAPTEAQKKRARAVLRILKKEYPIRKGFLKYRTPLDLAVATILSAQATDKSVNMVTPELFKKYRTAADYAAATQAQLERDIKTIGLYRNKAKNIRALGKTLVEKHNGKVPDTLEELIALPGIGRKTANVILNQAFDKPGMVVDTHVGRIAKLLELTKHTDATKIEFDLMRLFPKNEWGLLSLRLISHGRAVCIARRPRCGECPLAPHCPSAA